MTSILFQVTGHNSQKSVTVLMMSDSLYLPHFMSTLLSFQGPVLTSCTTSFWYSTTLRSAHTLYLCFLCGSENKQRLFPYTALTGWFFITDTECVYCAVRFAFKCRLQIPLIVSISPNACCVQRFTSNKEP